MIKVLQMFNLSDEELDIIESVEKVQEIKSIYLCSKCTKLLRKPYQLIDCGHRICFKCLDALPKSKVDNKYCPVDQTIIEDYFEDKCAMREILGIPCYCLYKQNGCLWHDKLQTALVHIKDCKFAIVKCPNAQFGCTVSVLVKDRNKHQMECLYTCSKCKYCSEPVSVELLTSHYNECPYYPVECETCGAKDIARFELDSHKKDCALQNCPIRRLGCVFQGKKREIRSHIKTEAVDHLTRIANVIKYSVEASSELDVLASRVKNDLLKLEDKTDILVDEEMILKEKISTADSCIQKLKLDQFSLLSDLKCLNKLDKDNLQEYKVMDIEEMERRFESIERRLTIAERSGRIGQRNGTQLSNLSICEKIKKIEGQMALVSSTRLPRFKSSLLMYKARWLTGNAVWKIDRVSWRMKNAIQGSEEKLYSPPLFTKTFGFKFCCCVYLNGEKMPGNVNKGYVSFNIHLVMTDYDHLLNYPFSREIKVSLIDQTNLPDRIDVVKFLYPEDNFYAYRKPVKELNEPARISKFCVHHLLYTRNYVKDDTLFFKVEVERNESEHAGRI